MTAPTYVHTRRSLLALERLGHAGGLGYPRPPLDALTRRERLLRRFLPLAVAVGALAYILSSFAGFVAGLS